MSETRPTISEALSAFIDDRRIMGQSRTARTYGSLLETLPDGPLEALTSSLCRQLVADRVQRNSMSTARSFRHALGSFCSWMMAQGWLMASPVAGVPVPIVRPKPSIILTSSQFRAIWLAAKKPDMQLILLLLAQGLRREEVVTLRWADLRDDGTIAFTGKGGLVRRVNLPEKALTLLKSRNRTDVRIIPITPDSLYQRVRRHGRRALGVEWLRPHIFRHSFATRWMLETGDMETLRTLGGWSDSSTQPRHYARLALEESAVTKARAVALDLFGDE